MAETTLRERPGGGPAAASGAAPVVDRPVFVVGMGRSGTTALFEALATHRDAGWLSSHLERLPALPAVAALARLCDWSLAFRRAASPGPAHWRWLDRLRDGPAEAYPVWERCCGAKFRYDYLLGATATPDEREAAHRTVGAVLRYQGKRRLVAKLTGPARMGYLMSIFPDARFVHVIRDGRSVVASLLRVPFWRDSARMREPAWRGGLSEAALRAWEARGRDPVALAALQWRSVIERTREERERHAPRAYLEVRYERFVAEPHAVLEAVREAAELPPDRRMHRFLERRLRPGAARAGRLALEPEARETVEALAGDLLASLGYERSPPGAAPAHSAS